MGPASGRHFPANPCFAMKENTVGVEFRLNGPPAKQQGPGSQRQPRPSLAYVDQRARGEKGQRCFAEQRCICAAVCCPRRVDVCRMQLSEPPFEPRVRWGLGDELPSWIWGDLWGGPPEGIFLPTPACPRRRKRGEWASSSGDHQQSSRAQGARGSPVTLWPMETQWLGVEKGQRCFAEQCAFALRFVPRGEWMFPECSSQNLVWAVGEMGPRC